MNPMMSGTTFAHYNVAEKLGEGGMGAVYKGEDTLLRRPVALKFLAASVAGDARANARFVREAQAAAALDHPNICQVYGMVEDQGRLCLVMAMVDGPSLADRMDAGLKLDEALRYAIEVGEGLRCAHDRGIVHRDIKASNILTTFEGVPKITDFGLALLENRSRLTERGTVMGTITAMAPEQVKAEDADRRTDIWALGILIYEMLTGRQPFERATNEDTMRAIIRDPAPTLSTVRPELPPDLSWILNKTLAKARAERYQHVDDLIIDLRAVRRNLKPGQDATVVSGKLLGDLPTLTAVDHNQPKSQRGRNWSLTIAAVTGLVVIVIALTWFSILSTGK